MTDSPYNPDDLALLASRSLDETLSESDAARLRMYQASSPEADRLVTELRAVDAIVKAWGSSAIEVNETAFLEGVLGRIADLHAGEASEVDAALRAWSSERAVVENEAFVEGVRRRLGEQSARAERGSRVYRLRRPLAAAAAVALLLMAGLWFERSARPVVEVSMSRSLVVSGGGTDARVRTSRVVIFERTVVADSSGSRTEGRGSFAVIGVDRIDEDTTETPPL